MRVLITGVDGFTGRYLATEMKAAGCQIHGLVMSPISLADVDFTYSVNLLDFTAINDVVQRVQPQWVIHLAAISFVAHSDVETIYRINILGTRNLLEALEQLSTMPTAVLLASSANIYGNSREGALSEDTPAHPANDYAVSKLAMEYLARIYAERLPIIVSRPFNYTGVGQGINFLLPKIVDHFKRRAAVIELGNLGVARDFSDVRMVVNSYRRLLQAPTAVGGVFNICTGHACSLQDVMALIHSITGHVMEVRVNPAFCRANEVRMLIGSNSRLEEVIGPIQSIPLEETLRWMLGA